MTRLDNAAVETKPRPRVLLVAEACNPEWTSVPLIGWSASRALAEVADVHLVTQVRNREAILRAGLVEGVDFTAIDSEKIGKPLYAVATKLRGGSGKGWTTLMAFNTVAYYYFEKLVWQRFRADLEAGRFDLVHRLTPLSPTVPSTLAAKCGRARIPFVIGPLNGGLPWPREFDSARRQEKEWLSYVRSGYKLMPGYRSTRRHAAAIIVASAETRRQLAAEDQERSVYIPENGIDPARFHHRRTRRAGRPLRAVFVGRLVPYKGADMLIEAAEPLLRSGALTLKIVGDGPQAPELRAKVEALGLAGAVALPGWVEHAEVGGVLAESDLFAFPSIREFGGGAVLEAMAVGLAPLIVDYGGPGELLNERTGIKVALGSRAEIVARFRSELERLCARPETVDDLGDAAYERVRALYLWSTKAQQIRAVYDWVLGRVPKPENAIPLAEPER